MSESWRLYPNADSAEALAAAGGFMRRIRLDKAIAEAKELLPHFGALQFADSIRLQIALADAEKLRGMIDLTGRLHLGQPNGLSAELADSGQDLMVTALDLENYRARAILAIPPGPIPPPGRGSDPPPPAWPATEPVVPPPVGATPTASVTEIDEALAQLRSELVQTRSAQATMEDVNSRAIDRLAQDDDAYWFRRWMTSLALGHGAAFFVICTGLLQAQHLELAVGLVVKPLAWFSLGLLCAGALPFLVWVERRYQRLDNEKLHPAIRGWQRVLPVTVVGLSLVSAAVFVLGLFDTLGAVGDFRSRSKPAQAERSAADAHLRPAPPPPAQRSARPEPTH